MLLGHWVEMRPVMRASRALEEVVKLMPAEAHRLRPDGSIEDIPLAAGVLASRGILLSPAVGIY
jgi:Cu2+-exporting ATPase